MRLFVALDLPPGPELSEIAGRMPSHFHATLRFFADLPEASFGGLCAAVEEAAGSTAPFELELKGIGAFPSAGHPRVVWVGFGRGRTEVEQLAERLDVSLRSRGFPGDVRAFQPHATLARVRSPTERASADRMLGRGAGLPFGVRSIEEIVVYESRLSPSGAEHRRVGGARLAATA
jgi:RNA 2',3'-cyclic 3'-phosphodiesterase